MRSCYFSQSDMRNHNTEHKPKQRKYVFVFFLFRGRLEEHTKLWKQEKEAVWWIARQRDGYDSLCEWCRPDGHTEFCPQTDHSWAAERISLCCLSSADTHSLDHLKGLSPGCPEPVRYHYSMLFSAFKQTKSVLFMLVIVPQVKVNWRVLMGWFVNPRGKFINNEWWLVCVHDLSFLLPVE